MIIQALHEYYGRLKQNVDTNIPCFGFSREGIHFALVIDTSGNIIGVKDLRGKNGNRKIAKQLIVPTGGKKASGIRANFMWGNTGYVLGKDTKEHKDKRRPNKMFKAFKDFQHCLGDESRDEGMTAVLKFIDFWRPEEAEQLEYWEEMAGMNVVFQLDGERKYIHEHADIQERWTEYCKQDSSKYNAFCLVSGQKKPIARLHPSIKGVKDQQPTGASIVSFNLNAFCSYGKKQSYNAPVGEDIAFNYTTAINHLLRFESRQRVQIGDASTVFWAEGETPVEGFLKDILDPPKDSEGTKGNIRRFLEATREGKMPKDIEHTKSMKFYILGLSPNASRLAVRFWYASTVEEISRRIGQHFKDLRMIKHEKDPEYPGMWHLLHETAAQGKTKNISPLLAGTLMRSIITGAGYPLGLLTAALERIRADQKINYLRAALIKAYLVRNNRRRNPNRQEVISMSLNREEKNVGYRLGRLFSILEKAQRDAIPGANTTIKDRFYGSASATPAVVFPQLLRLTQHHIQKSDFGASIDKWIEEVVCDIKKFPPHLSLEEQGMFAIGYYHQKRDFYKKKEEKEE